MSDKPKLTKRAETGENSQNTKEKRDIGPTLYNKDRKNISKLNEFDVSKSSYVMEEVTNMNIIQDLLESVDLIDDNEKEVLHL